MSKAKVLAVRDLTKILDAQPRLMPVMTKLNEDVDGILYQIEDVDIEVIEVYIVDEGPNPQNTQYARLDSLSPATRKKYKEEGKTFKVIAI